VRPLNDDDLNSLLRQAKASPLEPSPRFIARVERAYEMQVREASTWRHLLFGTIRVPIAAVVAASVMLPLAGGAFGMLLSRTNGIHGPSLRQNATSYEVDRNRPVLNLDGLQPVTELHLKIIRRTHENR
jgi:hypothetical protein